MKRDFKRDFTWQANIMKAFGDESRLYILSLLRSRELCGNMLLKELELSQPTLSHHMKILCDAGVVRSRKEGRWVYYSINPSGITGAEKILVAMLPVKRK